MVFRKFTMPLALLFVMLVGAQEKVLFSIDGEKVYSSEFERVYNKNKHVVLESEEKKEFNQYFDLFVNFKLKVKQAHDLKLDTSSTYINELAKYREQLTVPYLQSPEATELLVQEAYGRIIEEVKASHILIMVKPDAKPQDTVVAYNKIIEARNKILSGQLFDEVAETYSEDPSAKTNGGDLGYFSAFSMVYDFENAAYNTNVGEVSMPFRTQFGYHILKVFDKRASQGSVEIAHIMVKKDPKNAAYAIAKINDIYKKLEQGDNFDAIVIKHSDDKSTYLNGGKLPVMKSGRMLKPFNEAVEKLQKPGDISKPVKTKYGWHILKLVKRYPVKSFDELHDEIESKIKNGNRSKYVENSLAVRLSKNYTIVDHSEVLAYFYQGDSVKMESEEVLFSIDKKDFTAKDFNDFSEKNKKQTIDKNYINFKNKKIIKYYTDNLENTNQDFAYTYKEYQDGLLLFELLQIKIWDKAENDSIGLSQYFEANKAKYHWKKRGVLTIASCTYKKDADSVKSYLEMGKSNDEIDEMLNVGAQVHVLFSQGKVEEGSPKLPKDYVLHKGVSAVFSDNEDEYTIIKVDEILEPKPKKLSEARGEVINDYQGYLEEVWVKELRETYQVKVNKRNLKKLKAKLSQE